MRSSNRRWESSEPAAAGTDSGGSTREARPREQWMDVLRGTAAVLIVLSHALVLPQVYGNSGTPEWALTVDGLVAPFRIPTLMFLSGMLLGPSLAKGPRRYAVGKLRNIAWPYLVWVAVFGALSWPVWSVAGAVLGGSYLWFLLFLLIYYAAAWGLRRVPPLLVVALAFGGSVLAPDGSKFGERLLYLFAVFMAGYLVATRRRWLAALVSSRWTLVAAVIAAVVHVVSPLEYGYGPQSVLITAAGVVLLARASRGVADHRAMLPLRFAGRNSIVFYVSHYPVIAVVVTVASVVGMDTWGATAVLGAVVALTVATLLSLLRPHSLVSWLFTFPARGPGPAVQTQPDARRSG